MIPLGLNMAERRRLSRTLASSHAMRVTILVQNLVGDTLNDLSDRLIDGQVNIDATAEVTRSCTLSILDVNRSLAFASDSPTEGAMYLDRMIKVIYGVYVPEDGWVDIPVFTGPITKLDRAEDIVNIECQGKEALALGAIWKIFTRKKGANKVEVIKDLLEDRCGETQFRLPDMPKARLPKALSLGRENQPWISAKKLARSVNRQLFYDGDGVCRMRIWPGKPVFEFRDGEDGTIMSSPQITYNTENLKNIVWVIGGVPKSAQGKEEEEDSTKKKVDIKKNKKPIEAVAKAPANHPVSPERLGRGDSELYLLETIRESSIMKQADAQALADRRLRRNLLEHVDVTVDVMPIPFLEEHDIVGIKTNEFSGDVVLKQFSIPLVAGNTMSIGYTKRMPVINKKNRRNRK